MTQPGISAEGWESLLSYSEMFTCYSAAVATWLAIERDDWARLVNAGLWLTITEADNGLLGFAYFRPDLRADLGLVRTGAQEAASAIDGVLQEIERSGRVIIAGDGFHLPWHVAAGRQHAPHWYVLSEDADRLEVADPFACRNELGIQRAARRPVARESLDSMLLALPGDDPVHRLREVLALGDQTTGACDHPYQWFVAGEVGPWREPDGSCGSSAVLRLADHFRKRGQDPRAYLQADDIWSIARHRAFMCRCVQERALGDDDDALAGWVSEHAVPLVKKWSHLAPLLMQATLALSAGRTASASVPDTLELLAQLERSAALALEENSITI